MPRALPADYFFSENWDSRATEARFKHYTCTSCGHRTTTYEAFKSHRARCGGGAMVTLQDLLDADPRPEIPDDRPILRRKTA